MIEAQGTGGAVPANLVATRLGIASARQQPLHAKSLDGS
jgi:hypothetical protein